MVRINAEVSEEEKALFDEVVAESDADSHKEWILNHTRADAEELGVTMEDALADDETEEQSIVDTYDPDADRDVLTTDEMKQLAGEVEEINPDHANDFREPIPQGASYVLPLVASMARYRHQTVERSDVVGICEDVGLVTDHYIDNGANDLNVPGRVVSLLDDGVAKEADERETVGTDTDEMEVIGRACAASILILDVDNGYEARRTIEPIYEAFRQVDDDTVLEWEGTAFSSDVLKKAMYRLVGTDGVEGELPTHEYGDTEQLGDIDWPRTPEELVDYYVEEEDPGWGDNDGLRKQIVVDIENGLDRL